VIIARIEMGTKALHFAYRSMVADTIDARACLIAPLSNGVSLIIIYFL
jgi:hypothetical protein